MLKGAVLGFGNMGRMFTERINGSDTYDARIVAATNRGEANLRIARDEFGLRVAHRVEDILDGLDFVVVASTTLAHVEQVVAAAEAGCHIFCEKPIALSLRDADRMIDAVRSAGVITVVNYISRFNEGYIRIRDMVKDGTIGTVLSVTHNRMRGFGLYGAGARHRAILEPEESGGWTVHHACHDLDLLYWLGGPIRSVYAALHGTAPPAMSEEIVSGFVHFASGAHGVIEDSVCAARDHYTRVIGDRASLVMHGENEKTQFVLYREGGDQGEVIDVQDKKRPGGGMDHFLDCITTGTFSDADLADARHSLALAIAMGESAASGAPVTLPGA